MTKRDRVIAAFAHKQPDTVPWNIELTTAAMDLFAAYSGIDRRDYVSYFGNHFEKCSYNGGAQIKPGFFKDEFGVIWNRSGKDKDIGVVDSFILKKPNFEGYSFPKPPLQTVRESTGKMLANGRDTIKLGKLGLCLFERAWSLRGMENLLSDFCLEENFVAELLEKITAHNLEIINEALKQNIDGFYFGDDYGTQTGPLFSPEHFNKYIKPCLKKMFEPVKAAGKYVCLHSCGNISVFLPGLMDIGLDVYQTVQPEIYDLKKIKNEFGSRLCFWGAISTQRDLPSMTPEKIKRTVRNTIAVLGRDGGYVCAPTHQVPADVPCENIAAMLEVLKL
ncbi:MAG: hypothetical protein FWD78_01530 [Treponema sp.]|nr:hypothetical protein [Treponema sp.]